MISEWQIVSPFPRTYRTGQIRQQERQPGKVVTGVDDNQDVRITGTPLPGCDQPLQHLADPQRGHLGDVIVQAQPDRVQDSRSRRATLLQRGHERVRPARNQLVLAAAAAIHIYRTTNPGSSPRPATAKR